MITIAACAVWLALVLLAEWRGDIIFALMSALQAGVMMNVPALSALELLGGTGVTMPIIALVVSIYITMRTAFIGRHLHGTNH